MTGGENADLIWEIRPVTHRLPDLDVILIKVKSHRKRDTDSFHEVINDEMDNLANMYAAHGPRLASAENSTTFCKSLSRTADR